MAARLNKRQADSVIKHIKSVKIVKKLVAHVMGEETMTQSQCYVGLALLRKTVPDQRAIEMDIGGEGVTVRLISRLDPELTDDDSIIEHRPAEH